MTSTNLIVLLGPTASGKTRLAAHLAYAIQSEIISADSRQVYKQMNLGTGKDYSDYVVNEKSIPFHLIDVLEPGEQYHIDFFRRDFESCYNSIYARNKIPILCGGTALYIDAVLSQFAFTSIPINEALRKSLLPLTRVELLAKFQLMPPTEFSSVADTSTSKRLIRAIEINTYLQKNKLPETKSHSYTPLIIGLSLPLELRRQRIEDRLTSRLNQGMVEEVEVLLETVSSEKLIFYGLEYKFITEYLLGLYSYELMVKKLTIAIQQYAKRQMTYFRKMERDGKKIHWIDGTQPLKIQLQEALSLLKQSNS